MNRSKFHECYVCEEPIETGDKAKYDYPKPGAKSAWEGGRRHRRCQPKDPED